MSHLGSRVSALVDGQLAPQEAERALAHAAGCPRCTGELAAARQARRLLTGAANVEPAPDFAARLLALAPQEPPAARGREPWPASVPWPHPSAWPSPPMTGDLRPRTWPRAMAVAVGGVGLAAAGLFALGDAPPVAPNTHPADSLTVLARAATEVVPSPDNNAQTLTWMKDRGWTCPSRLPTGFAITAVHTESAGAVLEFDLAARGGAEIVVREREGRLDDVVTAGLETWEVQGRTVFVVSREPWHVVLQSGDTVVDVVADTDRDAVADVVAAFPAEDYDSGVRARIFRGWTAMTGALGTS